MKQIWAGGGGRHRCDPTGRVHRVSERVGGAVATGGDPTRSRKGRGGGRHRWRPYGAGKWLDIANDCMK